MSQACEVKVRFCRPPEALCRYFTTFYHLDIMVADGSQAVDFLHPEWANLRFHAGDLPTAEDASGKSLSGTPFLATGPSSRTVRFAAGPRMRMWGVGLLPLGWTKFVGCDAADLADAVVDGMIHPAFSAFAPLAESLFAGPEDADAELAIISRFFLDRAEQAVPEEARILALHTALIDPEVRSVAELVDRVGASQRTVERTCNHAFGFSPKLLLRRQRFMRSLTHFVLDPSLKWIGALDGQYHDQAQFVRDFKQFMGMTPRQYAALDKPILGAVMRERARFAGKAVQALDTPEGGAG